MSIWQIIRRLVPFVRPYSRWVTLSLVLTLLGAFAAQVNPIVLRYTVDTIEGLLREGKTMGEGSSLLLLISAVLFGKEVLNTGLRYGQNLFGEKIRVNVSSRLSQFAVEKSSPTNSHSSATPTTRPASSRRALTEAWRA